MKAELFYGAMRTNNPSRTLAKQQEFLNRFISLAFDDKTALSYGEIRSNLAAKGTPIGSNDLLIAAITVFSLLVNSLDIISLYRLIYFSKSICIIKIY